MASWYDRLVKRMRGYRITVNISAFQAEDDGSIPSTRTIVTLDFVFLIRNFLLLVPRVGYNLAPVRVGIGTEMMHFTD